MLIQNYGSINDDSQSLISPQSCSSSIYQWITNDFPNYFKTKIFPHYQTSDQQFKWGWWSFDAVRSTIAYLPKFLKQSFLNSHVPLPQAINIDLLPIKSYLELTCRLNPWQSQKIIRVLLATSILITLAEESYLNIETHDFNNSNNIYTIVDYSIEQICGIVNIMALTMDIGKSFEYFNGSMSNKINFSLKLAYQIINTGGAISLLTNPKLGDNLIPIISSAAVSTAGFSNFVIDDFSTFKQGFNCAKNAVTNLINSLATRKNSQSNKEKHHILKV